MNAMRHRLLPLSVLTLAIVVCLAGVQAFAEGMQAPFAVRAFGALGDGTAKDTANVQRAIDACAAAGGGTVYFGPGTYLCGSLHLRSNVTLELDNGATILGSTDIKDYDLYEELGFKNDADEETSYFHQALIWGESVEHVAIVGRGVIDSHWEQRHGPKAVALKRCRFVQIHGVQIQNAPNYSISLLGTDFVDIDGVTILNGYADGIDPDSCQNVRIANCHIESSDDAIVPKASFSLGERRATENITVTNCYLSTAANAFKLGTESGGDFKRIAVSNCVMTGLKGQRPASSGISLESVDGSNLDGVVISNITMFRVRAPIFIRLGNRGRDMETPVPGSLKNVGISNIVATEASQTCSVTGIPGHPVQGVTISDLRISFAGGCPYLPAGEPVPEKVDAYPDAGIFGPLPAYGFYCRHVDGLTLNNVQLSLAENYWRVTNTPPKTRPQWDPETGVPQPSEPGRPGHAIVCDDVRDLSIDGLRADPDTEDAGVLRFVDVRDAIVRGMLPRQGTRTFLEISGATSENIHLLDNALDRVPTRLKLDANVRKSAVSIAAGRR